MAIAVSNRATVYQVSKRFVTREGGFWLAGCGFNCLGAMICQVISRPMKGQPLSCWFELFLATWLALVVVWLWPIEQ